MDLSPIQILIVLAIALVVFGPRRLPEMAKSVGRGLREFKASVAMDDPPPAPPARATASAGAPVVAERAADDTADARTDGPGDDVLDGVLLPGDDQPPGTR